MYIVADIGGTKTRIAGSSDLETFSAPVIFETSQDYQEGLKTIRQHAQDLAGAKPIRSVAVGIPVVLSPDKRRILHASNVPLWQGKDFAMDLEGVLQAPALLENDTALVGLGEAASGAGRGAQILMYLTVSTGVNGVRIVDGKIDRSVLGFETGHQYFSMGDKPQEWGDMISGRAISKRFGVSSPRDLGKEHAVWEELARIVAFGVHNSILHWSPNRVVLGGSMFNEIGISVDRVRFHLEKIMNIFPELPEIVHSSLGGLGGLWGGLALLRAKASQGKRS